MINVPPQAQIVNATEIRRALNILLEPGQVVELRALDAKTTRDNWRPFTASGYYNSIDALVADAEKITEAANIYITLQALDTSLLARAVNRLRTSDEMKKGPTTADEHVKRFRWLLIDADVKRPAGISATDSEHDAALRKVQHIRETLSQEGWPEPVLGDSGNGGHLLYRIDLPADDKSIVEQALKGLAARFDDDLIAIDQTVFNPARICKLYGTRAGKGDDLVGIDGVEDRPHRLSRILEVPDTITLVSRELLATLAPVTSPSTPATATKNLLFGPPTPPRDWDMDDFISKYSIATLDKVPYNGGYKWHLAECPFCNSTDRGACLYQRSGGELAFKCSHNRCAGKDWKDYRTIYEPNAYAMYVPSTQAASNGNGHISTSGNSKPTTDLGNAERFAECYGSKAHWCETWKCWMVYNGKTWEKDQAGRVDQFAKATVRAIYIEAANESDDALRAKLARHANASESNRAIRAMLDRAKSELPITPEDFNLHLHLINCNNGTLDLSTGGLRAHDPKDMLTRCLKFNYNPLAECPRWLKFLQDIFAGNVDLIEFVHQALGMTLSGDIREQSWFLCYGEGNNGKTTMLEVIRLTIEAYGLAANIETFQTRKGDRVNNDVAEFYGMRMVTASENQVGTRLNEAFIKKITGNEPLRARRLHENEFQFMPECSVWLSVNHKPIVKDTSKGMWRRVRFIPFTVTIPDSQIDTDLPKKLLAEVEGILCWLVQGCMTWYQNGRLTVPKTVKDATTAYQNEMDTIASFLQDECTFKDNVKVRTSLLNERFEQWCKQNGEKEDAKTLKAALNSRGYHSRRGTGGLWVYEGITIDETGLAPSSDGSDGSDGSDVKKDIISRSEYTSQNYVEVTSLPSLPSLEEEKNNSDKVRNFATSPTFATPLFENKTVSDEPVKTSEEKTIAQVLAQLKVGKFAIVEGPDGAARITNVSSDSVELDHYGTKKIYIGDAILSISPF